MISNPVKSQSPVKTKETDHIPRSVSMYAFIRFPPPGSLPGWACPDAVIRPPYERVKKQGVGAAIGRPQAARRQR